MRGHFRHLHFKTFPTVWRTLRCEVFWPLQLRSEFSGVLKASQVPFSRVWVATSHFPQSGVTTLMKVNALHFGCFGLSFWNASLVHVFNSQRKNTIGLFPLNLVTSCSDTSFCFQRPSESWSIINRTSFIEMMLHCVTKCCKLLFIPYSIFHKICMRKTKRNPKFSPSLSKWKTLVLIMNLFKLWWLTIEFYFLILSLFIILITLKINLIIWM